MKSYFHIFYILLLPTLLSGCYTQLASVDSLHSNRYSYNKYEPSEQYYDPSISPRYRDYDRYSSWSYGSGYYGGIDPFFRYDPFYRDYYYSPYSYQFGSIHPYSFGVFSNPYFFGFAGIGSFGLYQFSPFGFHHHGSFYNPFGRTFAVNAGQVFARPTIVRSSGTSRGIYHSGSRTRTPVFVRGNSSGSSVGSSGKNPAYVRTRSNAEKSVKMGRSSSGSRSESVRSSGKSRSKGSSDSSSGTRKRNRNN